MAYRVVEMGLHAAAQGRAGHSFVTIRYEPRDLKLEIRGDRAIPDLDRTLAPLRAAGGALPRRATHTADRRRIRSPCTSTAGRGRPGMTIDVLIADDQALVRAGFRMIIDADPNLESSPKPPTVPQAIELGTADPTRRRAHGHPDAGHGRPRSHTPDPQPRRRAAAVLMLTTFDLDEYVFDALIAGASGFLLKDVAPEDSAPPYAPSPTATRSSRHRSPDASSRHSSATTEHAHEPPPGFDELTARELEILITARARPIERGDRRTPLRLPPRSRPTSPASSTSSNLRDRVQAVVLAYETGIIRPGSEQPQPPNR